MSVYKPISSYASPIGRGTSSGLRQTLSSIITNSKIRGKSSISHLVFVVYVIFVSKILQSLMIRIGVFIVLCPLKIHEYR